MTLSQSVPSRTEHAYVVRRPRPADAVGDSLRRIFNTTPSLPNDLHRLLCRLNQAG